MKTKSPFFHPLDWEKNHLIEKALITAMRLTNQKDIYEAIDSIGVSAVARRFHKRTADSYHNCIQG